MTVSTPHLVVALCSDFMSRTALLQGGWLAIMTNVDLEAARVACFSSMLGSVEGVVSELAYVFDCEGKAPLSPCFWASANNHLPALPHWE
mmetsp:Transcript_16400/g.52622  ORF Transcript_16400/g.52622 Transcript_16400/m.52622 type:complete len:90 (-) Transcript_16400:8-277(-)